MSFVVLFSNPEINKSDEDVLASRNITDYPDLSSDACIILRLYVLPVICAIGALGNILSLHVIRLLHRRCSTYSYLTAITGCDLLCCALILSSTAIEIWSNDQNSITFNTFILVPVATILSSVTVCSTVGVTLDRLFVLWKPTRRTMPVLCEPKISKKIVMYIIIICVFFNLPYFFIYTVNDAGYLCLTDFIKSRYYILYNWIRFSLFGIFPTVILPITTGLLIYCLKKVITTMNHLCVKKGTNVLDSTRTTVTLISLVVFFIAGEIPGQIVAKDSAFVFLYSGNIHMNPTPALWVTRSVVLVLGAINSSINFFLYITLHPPFLRQFKQMLTCKNKDISCNNAPSPFADPVAQFGANVQVNVFVTISKIEEQNNLAKILPVFSDLVAWTSR